VNLADLELRFDEKDEVTPELMVERGLIKKGKLARSEGVVILGKGSLSKALNITAHRFSKSAIEKIESAGGVATTVAGPVAEATSESAE
jgi:large subunit ribosomal protein L15